MKNKKQIIISKSLHNRDEYVLLNYALSKKRCSKYLSRAHKVKSPTLFKLKVFQFERFSELLLL